VALGNLFAGLEIARRFGDIHEGPQQAAFAGRRRVAEDGEILPPIRPLAREADIDPLLPIHADRVPALLQDHAMRGEVVERDRLLDRRASRGACILGPHRESSGRGDGKGSDAESGSCSAHRRLHDARAAPVGAAMTV